MRRILALVEGQTEFATLNRLIAAPLGLRGHSFQAKIIGKPGHKGGMRSYASMWPELVALLKQERQAVVTTIFFLYALKDDWPGWSPPRTANSLQRAEQIERAMSVDLSARIDPSDNLRRYIPYLQVHELETLLYADPHALAESFGQVALAVEFQRIVDQAGGCELIDDSPETAPSKRLEALFPKYKKGKGQRAHAPIAVAKIGLDTIRAACPHFSRWLEQLESADSIFT
jgi:hypothetical protein